MTAELIFDSVELRSGDTNLLGPVSLRLSGPGLTVIMGPNGAGKSLFLSAAHGLVTPDRGQVTWSGTRATASRASRGFVFQTTPVLRRSVAGNIALPLLARGVARTERNSRIASALTDARLSHAARLPAATLSGGERKRLALARAMVTGPDVVLLDEPAANLDPASTKLLEESLRAISKSGVKVILSTHDVAQARRLADDILFFDGGLMCEQAAAETFFAAPASDAADRYLKGEL